MGRVQRSQTYERCVRAADTAVILAIVSPVVVVGCGLQDEGATTLHSFTLSRDADKFSLTVQ